jgi:hypothetical protein
MLKVKVECEWVRKWVKINIREICGKMRHVLVEKGVMQENFEKK